MTAVERYEDVLAKLSDASVHKKFEPFLDIDWDAPDNAISDDDPRWVLSTHDPLGGHPWYRAQPLPKQIAIGKLRYASMLKVGLIFEQVLIGGLVSRATHMPNNTPDFRYSTHEVVEECNHTLMFQELIDRIGADFDVRHAGTWRRVLLETAPFIISVARLFPELFFVAILAGEEPIDYTQKSMLRGGADAHPLLARVVQIHIAEEARHISYAHLFLQKRAAEGLNVAKRWALSLLFPVIMRGMAQAILVPVPELFARFDIPDEVRKDLWWDSPAQQQALADCFGDVRALADEIGLVNPVSRRIWKQLGIWGDVSRYRSEPARRPARNAPAS